MVSPSALSLLTTTNPEGAARNRGLAIWQATTAAGATTGIIAGGLLTQYLGWRAVFLVNRPLIALMLVLVPRLPSGKPSEGQHLDVRGAVLVTTSLAALIFGLSNGHQHGFTTPLTIASLVVALVAAIGFVQTERSVAAPMVPAAIVASSTRRAAVGAMLIIGAVLAGYVYFVSLYLQRVEGFFSPLRTGLALVPATATVVLTTTLGTRRLLARFGTKRVFVAGLLAMASGQLWFAEHSGQGASLCNGGPAWPPVDRVGHRSGPAVCFDHPSTSGVKSSDQGPAGALFTAGQQTGAAVGLAVLATVAGGHEPHRPWARLSPGTDFRS